MAGAAACSLVVAAVWPLLYERDTKAPTVPPNSAVAKAIDKTLLLSNVISVASPSENLVINDPPTTMANDVPQKCLMAFSRDTFNEQIDYLQFQDFFYLNKIFITEMQQ